ncbi:MAG TPA: shikimate kinase [Trueperaceae bacterium]|nr:shikimate kinase [Trueperaceae bacterium]
MTGGHRHFAPERVVTWLAMAGFMGTGKSRIGWELSRRLQLTFIDTDRVIERVSCMRIPDLFELYGEGVFRDYEAEVVRRSVRLDEVVISTGGGTVVRPENRAVLRARGPVVVLTASPETIFRRTRRNKRPLLEHADPLKRIGELMAARAQAYDEVASFKVSTDGRPSAEVVEEIVERLQDWKRDQDARLAADAPAKLHEDGDA